MERLELLRAHHEAEKQSLVDQFVNDMGIGARNRLQGTSTEQRDHYSLQLKQVCSLPSSP